MARTIIIKNTTLSDIELNLGETIPAEGQLDLTYVSPHEFSNEPTLETLISSGDLVINDGNQDITNTILAIRYLQGNSLITSSNNTIVGDIIAFDNTNGLFGRETPLNVDFNTGELKFYGSTSGFTSIRPPAIGSGSILTLPSEIHDGGVLQTNSSGELSFTDMNDLVQNLIDTNASSINNLKTDIMLDSSTVLSNISGINFLGNVTAFTSSTAGFVDVNILSIDIENDDSTISTNEKTVNFEGNVSVNNEGTKTTVSVGGSSGLLGCIHQMTFLERSGSVANQWLGFYEDNISSNRVHGIIPWKSKLVGITFANGRGGVNQDIRIYSTPEGGGVSPKTLDYTFTVWNRRVVRKTDLPLIVFDAGDKIGVYLHDRGSNADTPVVHLYFQIIDDTLGSGSESYGGSFATSSGGGSS